ncbi:hypothetical protein M3Y94_00276000 [Aphelenchoides besseyi]|nr:hypothetical protein M3Y94_00276000 [Aphelenchoides besseyi]
MHAWFMDEYPLGDRRLPHRIAPYRYLTLGELNSLTGITCFKVDMNNPLNIAKRMSTIRRDKNYSSSDVFRIDHERLSNQSHLLDDIWKERTRDLPTIRMITGGSIYYDVSSKIEDKDVWIRVLLERGDLITIPSGLEHRSTTTGENFVRMTRFHQIPAADS